ncbi:MAG: hypothetical protein HY318_02750, partial [Armatimonadetes bacterium]|nr:hypothetical protein [Armatimonadota bacterium]
MSIRRPTTRERARHRRGLVLVIVLWILVILVILSWGLAATVQTEAHLVRHYSESSRCVEFARAGIEMMSNRLAQEDLSFVARDHPESQLTSERGGLAFQSGGKFEVSMEDEAGKVNLNVASTEMLTALTGDANLAAA